VTISRRRQLQLILLGYAIVVVYGAAAFFVRYLAALRDPQDSSGGMWAFGDLMLGVFVFGLLMVPTAVTLRKATKLLRDTRRSHWRQASPRHRAR